MNLFSERAKSEEIEADVALQEIAISRDRAEQFEINGTTILQDLYGYQVGARSSPFPGSSRLAVRE